MHMSHMTQDCNVAVQLVCMQIAWDVDALHNGTDPNDEVCCGPERQERSFLGQVVKRFITVTQTIFDKLSSRVLSSFDLFDK